MKSRVVLVHGLWMTGLEMSVLGARLSRCGYAVDYFRYGDLRTSPADNARRLDAWLRDLPGETVHFVGHSLGGIVLLHLFHQFPRQRPGRVVFLGTPARGSAVAARIGTIAGLRAVLGKSPDAGLAGGAPAWCGGRELGVVAGTLEWGVGHWLGSLPAPHDGTVAVAETRIDGASDQIEIPSSHMGMLFSAQAAAQVCSFLRDGRFEHTV